MKLWYNDIATGWTEALPIANGYMGAVSFGGEKGYFEISENCCWSGKKEDTCLSATAKESMKKARELLLKGEYESAQTVLQDCTGKAKNYGTQIPMAKLYVSVGETANKCYRELDITTGVAKEIMTYDNCTITRESFISNPAKVMAIKLSADTGMMPSVSICLEGFEKEFSSQISNNSITVYDRATESRHSDGVTGTNFSCILSCDSDGDVSQTDNGLQVQNAKYATIYLSVWTDMFDDDYKEICCKNLENAITTGWDSLFVAHVDDHSSNMNKCIMTLPKNDNSELPTDIRIDKFRQNPTDYDLIALYFQYGRYLIFNTSRENSLLPAVLQGIWNDNRACKMAWTDDIHIDINTQLNYFPCETTGLTECSQPLFKWIKDVLMPSGEKVANQLYDTEGWCAHTTSNAFGWASPCWGVSWGFSLTCGAWLALHIWEHYLYTDDESFLAEYYEVLYKSAQFLKGILSVDEVTGEYVTNPSYSPENAFGVDGKKYYICTGATFDMSIVKKMFKVVLESAQILEKEDDFTKSLADIMPKLATFKVGSNDQLQEWNTDFFEPFPDHRHTSHLLSMYPFRLIDPMKSEDLRAAIVRTLDLRMENNPHDIVSANWAGTLLLIYNAHLQIKEKAQFVCNHLISNLSQKNMLLTHNGGPKAASTGIYELDGNTGFTAGIAEMLLQSYNNEIRIMPAIPTDWKVGKVTGLTAHGGTVVDIEWTESSINVSLLPKGSKDIVISYNNEEKPLELKKDTLTSISFVR